MIHSVVQLKLSKEEIAEYLRQVSDAFVPPLAPRLSIDDYASKLETHAEHWGIVVDGVLAAFMACYFNRPAVGYITSISVRQKYQRLGIATRLIEHAVTLATERGFKAIKLEVFDENRPAVALYVKHGFTIERREGGQALMELRIPAYRPTPDTP